MAFFRSLVLTVPDSSTVRKYRRPPSVLLNLSFRIVTHSNRCVSETFQFCKRLLCVHVFLLPFLASSYKHHKMKFISAYLIVSFLLVCSVHCDDDAELKVDVVSAPDECPCKSKSEDILSILILSMHYNGTLLDGSRFLR